MSLALQGVPAAMAGGKTVGQDQETVSMSDRTTGGDNDLERTVAKQLARITVPGQQVHDTRHLLYTLLDEMGGREVSERNGRQDA